MTQIEAALAAAREAYALAQASSDPASIAASAREVRYWSSRRASARVLPSPVDISEVRFGTTVTIVRDDGRGFHETQLARLGEPGIISPVSHAQTLGYFLILQAVARWRGRLIIQSDPDYLALSQFNQVFGGGDYVLLLAEAPDLYAPAVLARLESTEAVR
jgi:hypothetical protein